jgi:hypothetical protein
MHLCLNPQTQALARDGRSLGSVAVRRREIKTWSLNVVHIDVLGLDLELCFNSELNMSFAPGSGGNHRA